MKLLASQNGELCEESSLRWSGIRECLLGDNRQHQILPEVGKGDTSAIMQQSKRKYFVNSIVYIFACSFQARTCQTKVPSQIPKTIFNQSKTVCAF
jgi:hypothetical protein